MAGKIERVNGKELSYKEFVERYLVKNQPVVLTGLMDDWKACKDWVSEDLKPNFQFFSTHFGNSRVQVAECGKREFTDQKRVEMTVSELINQWLEMSNKDLEENDRSLLYLKDWHFVKEYPGYVAYTTPLFFRDDWLNLYLNSYHMHVDPDTYQETNDISCSDYRFVYMGAKGTWTPLHADVFRSYSWSANICGKKQWHFLSPSQCHLVFDRNMKNSVYDIFDDVSEAKFPGFKKAIWVECIQGKDEIIFVPSGWYHQVHNLEDTISINHNWFNGHNLSWVWKLLVKDYHEAKSYIEDIRDISDDFEGLCQRNLAANTGMNFSDFFILITRFSLANLIHVYSNKDLSTYTQHFVLNLISTRNVCLSMKSIDAMKENTSMVLDLEEILREPLFSELLKDLESTYRMICDGRIGGNETSNVGVEDLELPPEVGCTRVYCPDDLVRVIDTIFANLGVENS
ncbi:Arginine-specific demethylase jmj20 [Ranunculus cassubicifolius]